MKRKWVFVLVALLAAPVWGSAQTTGHQHHQGHQQMQHMEHMQQMVQRMGWMHEQLQEMHGRLGQGMGHMMSMTEAEHMHRQRMRGLTEAMSQMADQMHSALARMMEMAAGPAVHQDAAMHEDLEELHRHMQRMTEGMEASLEVLLRLERSMGGGRGAR